MIIAIFYHRFLSDFLAMLRREGATLKPRGAPLTFAFEAKAFLDCGDESGTSVQPLRDVIMSACFAANDESADGARKVPLAILAVGPERGWTDGEAKLFQEAGFDMALLGNSILRVSTAVVAGLALASAALDECIQLSRKKRKHDTSEC